MYLTDNDPLRARVARLEQSLEQSRARAAELKERGAALKERLKG